MSKKRHAYPALSLKKALSIIGNRDIQDLKADLGELRDLLKQASVTKSVAAWDSDVPYSWSEDAENKIINICEHAAQEQRQVFNKISKGKNSKDRNKIKRDSPTVWDREQLISGALYSSLGELPVAVQEDSEFWIYVSCVAMLDLLMCHSEAKIAGKHLGTPKTTEDVDSSIVSQRSVDIIAKRIYLRTRTSALANVNLENLKTIKNLSEAESSHLLSGRTGRQPLYASALTEKLRKEGLTQKDLRDKVRSVYNPRKATKVVETMTSEEVKDLLK
jgi:hypothetical protein